MAQANIGSRRACEALIEQGRVRVNGKTIKLGDQADPDTDTIEVDGERLRFAALRKVYIAYNKPRNILSTNKGHPGDDRRTVREMIPHEGHLFTIGRLDAESEGLIILTNDGAMANRLSHPRYRHTKTYRVSVYGLPTADAVGRWQQGMQIDEETQSAPCYVRITKGDHDLSILRIVMTEGKKRQIRRVAGLLGYPVKRLVRTHIGQLEVRELRPGEWRELTPQEVKLMTLPAPELKEIARQQPDRQRRRPATDSPTAAESEPRRRSTGKPARPARGERPSRAERPTTGKPRRSPRPDTRNKPRRKPS